MLNSTKEEIHNLIYINLLAKKIGKIDIPDGIRLVFIPNPDLWMEVVTWKSFTTFYTTYSIFNKNYPVTRVNSNSVDNLLVHTQSWIDSIEKWIEEQRYSDPWEKRYKKYKLPKGLSEGMATIDFKEDKPFTEDEQERVQKDFEISKEYIKQLQLPENRYKIIEEKIDFITELIKTENKVTWLKLSKEFIMSAVVNAATDTETLMKLLALFGKLLKIPFGLLNF